MDTSVLRKHSKHYVESDLTDEIDAKFDSTCRRGKKAVHLFENVKHFYRGACKVQGFFWHRLGKMRETDVEAFFVFCKEE